MKFSAAVHIEKNWPDYKSMINGTTKSLFNQFVETPTGYDIFALDGPSILYLTSIWQPGFEPDGWTQQEIDDNASWLADFEDNYKAESNKRVGSELTITEKNNLELDIGFSLAREENASVLTYAGSQLTKIEVYEDETYQVLLFQKDFTYSGSQLVQVVITRQSDGAVLTKDILYSGSEVSGITRTNS